MLRPLVLVAVLSGNLYAANPACLAERLSIFEIKTKDKVAARHSTKHGDNPSSMLSETAGLRPVQVRGLKDGIIVAAWQSDKGTTHIQRISMEEGTDLGGWTLNSGKFQDLVAHDDGTIAVLTFNGSRFYLTKLDKEAKTLFSTQISGEDSLDWHVGSVEWNGSQYAVYHGIQRGGHQGDTARILDANGVITQTPWDWVCSHSIDLRIVNLGNSFRYLCNSDAFGPGIRYHGNTIISHWGDASGNTGGRIGSVGVGKNKVAIAYSGYGTGRFFIFDRHTHAKEKDLQFTNHGGRHHDVKIGALGEDQFVYSWREKNDKKRHFRRINEKGELLSDTEEIEVTANPRSDFRTAPNGDLIWASANDDHKITVMRMKSDDSLK